MDEKMTNVQCQTTSEDGPVKSLAVVIPAKAGIEYYQTVLDSRLRGNNVHGRLMTFYDFIK
jgi:hypothetical protein